MATAILVLAGCALVLCTEVQNAIPRYRAVSQGGYWVPGPQMPFQRQNHIGYYQPHIGHHQPDMGYPQPYIDNRRQPNYPPPPFSEKHGTDSKFQIRIILNGTVEVVKTYPKPTSGLDLSHPIIIHAILPGVGTWTFQIPPIRNDTEQEINIPVNVATTPQDKQTTGTKASPNDNSEVHYVPVKSELTYDQPEEPQNHYQPVPNWIQPQAFGFIPIPLEVPQMQLPQIQPAPALKPQGNIPLLLNNRPPVPAPPSNQGPVRVPPSNKGPVPPKKPDVLPAPPPGDKIPLPRPPLPPKPVPIPVDELPDLVRVNKTNIKAKSPRPIDVIGWTVIGVSIFALVALLILITVCLCCKADKHRKRRRRRPLSIYNDNFSDDDEIYPTNSQNNIGVGKNQASYTLVPGTPSSSESSGAELMSKRHKERRQSWIRDKIDKETKKATSNLPKKPVRKN